MSLKSDCERSSEALPPSGATMAERSVVHWARMPPATSSISDRTTSLSTWFSRCSSATWRVGGEEEDNDDDEEEEDEEDEEEEEEEEEEDAGGEERNDE